MMAKLSAYMKRLVPGAGIVSILLILFVVTAEGADLQELFERGEYQKIIKQKAGSGEEAVLRLQALYMTGNYEQVLDTAQAYSRAFPDKGKIISILAATHLIRGDLDSVRELYEKHKESTRGVYLDYLRLTAAKDILLKEALSIIRSFKKKKLSTADDVLLLSRAYRYADNYQAAMNCIQEFKTEHSPDKMRLLVETGELFAGKYNSAAALSEYAEALKINMKYVPALFGVASVYFEKNDFKGSEEFCRKIFYINPQHMESHLLIAFMKWMGENYQEVEKEIEVVLGVNRRHPAAHALMAAMHKMKRQEKQFEEILLKREQLGYADYEFYFPLAKLFESRKKWDLAIEYFRRLLAQFPKNASVLSEIGWHLLRKGQLEEAKEMFEQAHEIDNYNYRNFNILNLFDRLEGYSKKETANFDIIYDPLQDEVCADYFYENIENIYSGLSARYDYTLSERGYIFFFPKHSYLAVMTTGIPRLGMPALCMGNSVYCDTPNVLKSHLSMNWYSVIRHELVHVCNLLQTDFSIPHWFTEGLAVFSEKHEHRYLWDRILQRAFILRKLHIFKDMNKGFFVPEDRFSRLQAYAESHFAVLYLIKNYGFDKINEFLGYFTKGYFFEESVKPVLGISIDELQEDLNAYYRLYLNNLRISPVFIPEDFELLKMLFHNGNIEAGVYLMAETGDPGILGFFEKRGDVPERILIAQALFYFNHNEIDKALTVIDRIKEERTFDFYRIKGECLLKQGKTEEAQAALISAWEIYGWEPETIYNIAAINKKKDDHEKYCQWMDRYLKVSDDHTKGFLEYAVYLKDRGELHKAVAVLTEAEKINPSDPEVRLVMGECFLRLRRFNQAVSEYRKASILRPDDTGIAVDLVKVLRLLKRDEEADMVIDRLRRGLSEEEIGKLLGN